MFLKLTNMVGNVMYINPDYIVSIHEHVEDPTEEETTHIYVIGDKDACTDGYWVKESAEEILGQIEQKKKSARKEVDSVENGLRYMAEILRDISKKVGR